MTYQKIQLEFSGDVALITLNDPAALNSVSVEMVDEIADALNAIEAKARALVLTGAGRAFCAGANLTAAPDLDEDGNADLGAALETHINPLMTRLRDLPFPWVSAVRGPAAGVGCSLALAADLIVASESAYFLQAFAKIGLVPDGGSSWLISRAVGRVRAMEMMLLAERIPAAKAFEWGLINRLVPDAELEDAALVLASGLASGPTRSLGLIRAVAWAAADQDWEQVLMTERRAQRTAGATADHREGVAAFLEKRPAVFLGG